MRKAALAVGMCLAVSACSPASWQPPAAVDRTGTGPNVGLVGVADGATGVSTAAEFGFTTTGAGATVSLVDAAGKPVAGTPRTDGSSWVPARQLDYGSVYTVTASATGPGGRTEAKARFTTMARPGNLVDVRSSIGDDQVVGVGMPVVVTFGADVPDSKRADIQKRLFVTSDPPQEGVWNWISPAEVHFRPRVYWREGTRLLVRLATGGVAWGAGDGYGRHDVSVAATVGVDQRVLVDNHTKTMTVTRGGEVVLTVPVSLGEPSAPSSSGNLVIMSRSPWEWFDSSTYGVPVTDPSGYRTKVSWTMRLTWDGQYIHAAPWSVASQGRRNVSHGCVNIPTAEARWLFDRAQIGDPVTVVNTETHVAWGNGWTDWDKAWDEYVKGSAIPYQMTPLATPSGSVG